ncbi:hypothetical protein JCGZ_15240 [Jatropha curcas]|uniref:Uncharacterized protein n=1 Tax=Jatropha curcas TaxID=180498 RepID=A0A067K2T1_JATCU|nr:hypothetical protein JCGZ_15240 [Jatropha curcas]
MSQISEIPASAYTPEMEVLGALPDIPTFDGRNIDLISKSSKLGLIGLKGFDLATHSARRVTQVGVAWRGCSTMNSCVTQPFLWEQLRDAAVRDARNPHLP